MRPADHITKLSAVPRVIPEKVAFTILISGPSMPAEFMQSNGIAGLVHDRSKFLIVISHLSNNTKVVCDKHD